MKLITTALLLGIVLCTAFPKEQYPEDVIPEDAPEEEFEQVVMKHGLGEHPVCKKACDSLPAPLAKYRNHCVQWCEKLEPPLNVVELLAKTAKTTEEKIEKVFSFIAREAVAAGGKFPDEKKIAAFAIGQLRVDAVAFGNAAMMVKVHLMEVQSKDEKRDHPVCAKACGGLPDKLKKHARECVQWCESMEPPMNVVQVLAKAAQTPEENIEKLFGFIAQEAVAAGGEFPDKAKIAQHAIGKLNISSKGFSAAAAIVTEHIEEVMSK